MFYLLDIQNPETNIHCEQSMY